MGNPHQDARSTPMFPGLSQEVIHWRGAEAQHGCKSDWGQGPRTLFWQGQEPGPRARSLRRAKTRARILKPEKGNNEGCGADSRGADSEPEKTRLGLELWWPS